MKTNIIIAIICLLAGFTLAFFVIHPKVKTVPGPVQVQYKDKIVYQKISGQTTLKPQEALQGGQGTLAPDRIAEMGSTQPIQVAITNGDFKASVPIKDGEIKTNHIDLKFTGNFLVEKQGDQLSVDLQIDPDIQETLFLPKPKTWYVGIGGATDFKGLYYGLHIQKDFPLWKSIYAFGRVEIYNQSQWLKGGIEINF